MLLVPSILCHQVRSPSVQLYLFFYFPTDEIDYLAFVRLMKTKLRKFDEDVELRESFRRFDKEENGYLDLAKLKSLLLTDGEPLTKATLKDWLDDGAEFIKNGKLYYEDFATFMLSK